MIKHLSAQANSYTFNTRIPFRTWLHACKTIFSEAKIYESEPDLHSLERAFILHLRFADLVVNKLPTHPEFQENAKRYKIIYKFVEESLNSSQTLKAKIIELNEKNTEPTSSKANSEELKSLDAELDQALSNSALTSTTRSDLPQFKLDTRPQSGPVNYELLDYPTPQLPPKLPELSQNSQSVSINYPELPPKHTAQQPAVAPHLTMKSGPKPPIFKHTIPTKSKLRQIFCPTSLRSEFLAKAQSNTKKNLETCGMLCGKLSQNAFFITHLVLPQQNSTANSCVTTNEEDLFDFVDQNNLFLVGWIHTHPTQTCFMSSVDLHTHASYQLMLPESVAIVCAPRHKPNFGVFRLTDPPGMDIIKKCHKTGFHPHQEPHIYEQTSKKINHFKELEFGLEVVDMRST